MTEQWKSSSARFGWLAGAVGAGIPVEGESLDARTLLVDVKVDLDTRYAQPAKDPTVVDEVLDALELEGLTIGVTHALPIPELIDVPYKSTVPNVKHACVSAGWQPPCHIKA